MTFIRYFLLIIARPRVFSLKDLQNEDNNSSDDEKQTYFAGGEKSYNFYRNKSIFYFFSGTAVQGGGKKGSGDFNEAQNLMGKIFAKASSEDPSKKQKGNLNLFSGSGNNLKLLFAILNFL